jgi:hypothetical protein
LQLDKWRFYQGVRNEWRWYHFDENGDVAAGCDQGFDELAACMDNAAEHGFDRHSYQVLTREPAP